MSRFIPAQAEELAARFNDPSGVALEGGDVALFGLLNYPEVSKTAVIARSGPVMASSSTVHFSTLTNTRDFHKVQS